MANRKWSQTIIVLIWRKLKLQLTQVMWVFDYDCLLTNISWRQKLNARFFYQDDGMPTPDYDMEVSIPLEGRITWLLLKCFCIDGLVSHFLSCVVAWSTGKQVHWPWRSKFTMMTWLVTHIHALNWEWPVWYYIIGFVFAEENYSPEEPLFLHWYWRNAL